MKLYFLESPDGREVLTDLKSGKYMAFKTPEEAEEVLQEVKHEFPGLIVKGREVLD